MLVLVLVRAGIGDRCPGVLAEAKAMAARTLRFTGTVSEKRAPPWQMACRTLAE